MSNRLYRGRWVDEAHIVNLGRGGSPLITFNRPNDTANYLANDVIGSASTANLELPGAGEPGQLMQLLGGDLTIDRTTLPTGMTSLVAHVWNAAPVAIADNAPFATNRDDRAKYIGSFTLPTPSVIGGGFLYTFGDYIGRPVPLATSSLWVNLVTSTAITGPAALTEYRLRLHLAEVGE